MSGRPAPAPLAWVLLLGRTLATVVVTLTCGLAIWSVLPRAAGWSPSVVMTGSMEPRLHPGDVVLSAPATALTVMPGQIIVVTNPAMPSHQLVHRFVRFTSAGDLITKGDANRREDSSPVPPSSVRGLPRLRLPYIGLGIVWLHDHAWRQLGLAALAILAACGLLGSGAGPALTERSGETQPDDPAPVDREPRPAPVRRLPDRDPATGRFIPARAGR
ncbi:MAG: signal peptidase [Frankiales bacterium]|jgi:signal peptidase|nr:signal peptidase [Frankiales bacterium]